MSAYAERLVSSLKDECLITLVPIELRNRAKRRTISPDTIIWKGITKESGIREFRHQVDMLATQTVSTHDPDRSLHWS